MFKRGNAPGSIVEIKTKQSKTKQNKKQKNKNKKQNKTKNKSKNKINKSKSNVFPEGLWQEAKSAHAWKDELPGAKREILSLSYYYCYRKDPFPSAACKVANVLTKSWAGRQPCHLLATISPNHTSPDTPMEKLQTHNSTRMTLIYLNKLSGKHNYFYWFRKTLHVRE